MADEFSYTYKKYGKIDITDCGSYIPGGLICLCVEGKAEIQQEITL